MSKHSKFCGGKEAFPGAGGTEQVCRLGCGWHATDFSELHNEELERTYRYMVDFGSMY